MRYNSRVTLIKVETIETPLGVEETETRITVPCAKQNTSFNVQVTLYGQVVKDSVKLHFPKVYEGYDKAVFEGEQYAVKSGPVFRHKCVMYLSRSIRNG